MTAKRKVRITLDSANMGQHIVQEAEGDLYLKNDHIYIRYEETQPETGRTTTTMKIDVDRMKIIRHGQISAEQTFLPGEWMNGYYQTVHGKMNLRLYTHYLHTKLDDCGNGLVEWEYDLEVMDDPAGLFTIKLTITDIAI